MVSNNRFSADNDQISVVQLVFIQYVMYCLAIINNQISVLKGRDVSVDTHDFICVIDASTQTEINYSEALTQPYTPNNGYFSDSSTIIITEDEYNCDVTFNTHATNPNTYGSDAAVVNIPEGSR